MIVSGIEISFEYGEENETVRREIIRNVRTVLATPIGICPLYREFGLDISYLDYPLDVSQNFFTVAAIEAVERWEPRVRVKSVTFEADGLNGALKAKVVIESG